MPICTYRQKYRHQYLFKSHFTISHQNTINIKYPKNSNLTHHDNNKLHATNLHTPEDFIGRVLHYQQRRRAQLRVLSNTENTIRYRRFCNAT